MSFDFFDVFVLLLNSFGVVYFVIQYIVTRKSEHRIAIVLSGLLLPINFAPILGIPIGQIFGDIGLFWPLVGLVASIGILLVWFGLKGWS